MQQSHLDLAPLKKTSCQSFSLTNESPRSKKVRPFTLKWIRRSLRRELPQANSSRWRQSPALPHRVSHTSTSGGDNVNGEQMNSSSGRISGTDAGKSSKTRRVLIGLLLVILIAGVGFFIVAWRPSIAPVA